MLLKNVLLVAAGGGLGAISRYLGHRWVSTHFPGSFPLGTFLVNIIGCFVIGLLFGLTVRNTQFSNELKLLFMTGFCGGFTTFSSFTVEGLSLLQQDRFLIFLLYFTGSVIVGLTVTYLGYLITR